MRTKKLLDAPRAGAYRRPRRIAEAVAYVLIAIGSSLVGGLVGAQPPMPITPKPVGHSHWRSVPFYVTVTGLSAAPGYVMLAYPVDDPDPWDNTDTSSLIVVREGERIEIVRGAIPTLYLMSAAAFRAWSAAHPHMRGRHAAAEKLIHSKKLVRCNAQVRPVFEVHRSRAEYMKFQDFQLIRGNSSVCRTRELAQPPR